MREILFRGKTINTGEWVEGWFVEASCNGAWPLKPSIVPAVDAKGGFYRAIEVDPETIGQFTGLFDRAGKRVFEGDIIRHTDYDGVDNYAVVKYGKFNCSCCHGVYGWTFEAKTDNTNQEPDIRYCNPDLYWITDDDRKGDFVVGNRWDSPELVTK